jgi:hypothetical protein
MGATRTAINPLNRQHSLSVDHRLSIKGIRSAEQLNPPPLFLQPPLVEVFLLLLLLLLLHLQLLPSVEVLVVLLLLSLRLLSLPSVVVVGVVVVLAATVGKE